MECALDYGISERNFWEMTLAEVERDIKSRKKMQQIEDQKRASYDYILADLIGRSIGRLYSSSNHYPDISEVYPSLFDSKEIQEIKQQQKYELSALRFKHFAQSYNDRIKKEVAKDNE